MPGSTISGLDIARTQGAFAQAANLGISGRIARQQNARAQAAEARNATIFQQQQAMLARQMAAARAMGEQVGRSNPALGQYLMGNPGLIGAYIKNMMERKPQSIPEGGALAVPQDPFAGSFGGLLGQSGKIPGYDVIGGGRTGAFRGKSVPGQAYNFLMDIGPKIQAGTATPEERQLYGLAHRHVTQSQVVGTPQTGYYEVQRPPLPSGFPSPGGAPAARPSGPSASPAPQSGALVPPAVGRGRVSQITPQRRQRSPEQAGRVAMISEARNNAQWVHDQIIKPDGTVDQELVLSMWSDFPRSKGRRVRARFRSVLSAKLRLETGAQANEQELADMARRYLPTPADDEATIRDKLSSLPAFMDTSLQIAAPDLYDRLVKRAGRKLPTLTPGRIRRIKTQEELGALLDDMTKNPKKYTPAQLRAAERAVRAFEGTSTKSTPGGRPTVTIPLRPR